MSYKLNVFTGVLDIAGIFQDKADARYLKLDQTTSQKVVNGAPKFWAGIRIKPGEKLILDSD